MHAGHFGNSAKMALGTTHPVISRLRRAKDGGRRPPSLVPADNVSRPGLLAPSSAQRWLIMIDSPPHNASRSTPSGANTAPTSRRRNPHRIDHDGGPTPW